MSSNTERSRGAVGRFSRFGAAALAAATLLSGLVVATSPTTPALAVSLVVDDVGDGSDAVPGNGVCATSGGVCTLRAAIEEANALPGVDTITFNIGGAGQKVITPPSIPLPTVTEAVAIDGFTQPGSAANTASTGTNAVYVVELSGTAFGGTQSGLVFGPGASNSVVRGIDFHNWDAGVIAYAKVTVAGNVFRNNVIGAQVNGGSSSVIGGPALADRNHVLLNSSLGVQVTGAAAGVTVRNNLIGTDATGTVGQGNGGATFGAGVEVTGSATNTLVQQNVISGNVGDGVNGGHAIQIVNHSGDSALSPVQGTQVLGNLLGTTASGNAALRNAGSGVILWSENGALVGPTAIGDGTVAGRNIISGNGHEGVSIWDGVSNTTIRGNYLGLGADGVTTVGNGSLDGGAAGVVLRNFSSGNTVGGTTAGFGNVITGNPFGIVFYSGSSNAILGNSIYGNASAGIALGGVGVNDPGDVDGGIANEGQNHPIITPWLNGSLLQVEYSVDSLEAYSAYPITVDFFEADDATSGEGKVFLGRDVATAPNDSVSVNLGTAAALGVAAGDPIVAVATDANGNSSIFSPPTEVVTPITVNAFGDTTDTTPGDGACVAVDGGCTLRAAIAEANARPGVDVVAFGIAGSGMQVLTVASLPPITEKVIIDAYGQTDAVRGSSPTTFDAQLAILLTSPSFGTALQIQPTAAGTVIRGLQISGYSIGVHAFAQATIAGNRIGSNNTGVQLESTSWSYVGGTRPEDRNLISGNSSIGVHLVDTSHSFVQGNLIGTTANGTSGFGNTTGVSVERSSNNNLIGGTAPGARNVISGNSSVGVDLQATDSDPSNLLQNTIQGNYIGTTVTGNAPLGNGYGIWLAGGTTRLTSQTLIGGDTPAARNVIAGNAIDGITIRQNVQTTDIYGNFIGLGANGTTVIGNGTLGTNSMGISVTELSPSGTITGTVIGYPGPPSGFGNVITGSDIGVGVTAPVVGVSIRGNSIYGNAQYGIRLFGTTTNDADDADTGPNNRQNHPTFTASVVAGNVTSDVTLDSLEANTQYPVQVDLYETGLGAEAQGKRFVTTGSLLNSGTTLLDFGTASSLGITPGDTVVMTATDANGNTSQFSPQVTVGPLPGTATFVNTAPGANFNDPANWDVGHVPGPLETAIIPASSDVDVNASTTIGSLQLSGTLRTAGAVVLTINGDSQVPLGGALFVEANGTLALYGDLLVDGQMVVRPTSLLTVSGTDARIDGGGVVSNSGTVRTVDDGTDLTIGAGISWNTGGSIEAFDGPVTVETPTWNDFGARYAASPGKTISFGFGLTLSPDSIVELGINGAVTDPDTFGRLQVNGALTRDGILRTVVTGYTPTTTDVYPAISCGDCFFGIWGGYDTQPLEPVTTQFGISLRTLPDKVISDTPGLQGLGASIDVDGDWAIVGQTNGGDTPLNQAVIYHYDNITDRWEQIQAIQGPVGSVFGEDVAIDGNWIAITNRGPGGADDTTVVYNRLAAGPFTNLVGSRPGAGSVAIDHGMMVVGDPEGGTTGGLRNAMVYRLDSFGITMEQVLWPHGNNAPEFVDSYGSDVAIWFDPNTDEGTIAVGAPEPAGEVGRVYIFTRGTNLWNADPVEILSETDGGIDGSDTIDQYGWSVSVTPDFLAVGHRLYDDPGHDQGAVWVYGGVPGVYGNNGNLVTASDADVSNVFGASVALEGNRLVVGSPVAQKFGEPLRDGAVYVFENTNDSWDQIELKRAADGQAFDFYGGAVAMSGSVVLVGAAFDANDNGPDAGAFYSYGTTPLVTPPGLSFDLGVATGSPSTVSVAPTGLAVTLFDRSIAAARASSNIAASSISDIGVEDTGLASITIDSIPLRSVVLSSAPLRSVSLVDIEILDDGGWPALLAGTELENKPLANVTFGEALTDPVVNDRIAALPLRSVNVDGTPLRSVPIAAVALGETPLRSVPLRSVANGEPDPWCEIIASLLVESNETCDVALGHLTLLEVSLRGVSLDAVPLRSVPLRSVDMEVSPLRSVPLRSVDLDASPLRSVPLRSVPLRSVPLRSVQVGNTTLADIPLRSVPLRSVPLRSVPLRSVMVGNTALADILIDDTPLRSVVVEGLVLDGTPLRSVPLRSVPLRSVDLTGSPLRSVPLRSVPLRSVPLRSVDLYVSPLRSVPLRSVDIEGSALAQIPLRSVDLANSPLRSVPLRSVPLTAIPLRSVPLRSVIIAGTPLRSVPLRSVDVLNSPLRSVPLRSVQLLGVAVDCAKVKCEVATLGDAYAAGAISLDTTLGEILAATGGISLGELAPYFLGFGSADILDAFVAGDFTLADLPDLDGITLGDLPSGLAAFADMTLDDLGAALATVTYGDLVGHAVNPQTGALYTEADLLAELDAANLTIADLVDLGNLTLGDLFDASNGARIGDLGSLLDLLPVDSLGVNLAQQVLDHLSDPGHPTLTLGDLTPDEFGNLTLGDIAALMPDAYLGDLITALASVPGLLDGFTLDDLLLALVDPGSLAQAPLPITRVNVAALPQGAVGSTKFQATFTLTGDTPRNVAVEIAMPGAATYVVGSALIDGTAVEPLVSDNTLQWNLLAAPGVPYDIRFDVLPTLRLGATSLSGVGRIVGTDIVVPATATVTVSEGIEPNDFAPATGGGRQTTAAADNTVYLTYISSRDDIDVFEIDLNENDQLAALLSNLDADLDMYLWRRPPANDTTGAALGGTSDQPPLFAVTDPDAAGVPAEPMADFVRLDQLDPTLQLIASSNGTGNGDEAIRTERLPAGTYYVQVVGANGATNVEPASLQLKVIDADTRPACSAYTLPARVNTPAAPQIPAAANTLILVNASRMEQLYGSTDRDDVQGALARLQEYLTGDGASLGIVPAIVPVDAYESVRNAYDHWDTTAGACDPDAANAVVAAINQEIIDPNREQFDHIVMIGGDQVIPMARLADKTAVANEYDFRHEFDGKLAGNAGSNAATASMWESTILSDEPYGEAAARSLGDRFLYVSDAALGRVVETPAEIVDALDTFALFEGTLSIDTATVLGYDFLSDGSEVVADNLAAGGLTVVDRELADGFNPDGTAWDRLDAETRIRALTGNALVSLNAHFDHYRALPAAGDKVPGFTDNLSATELAPGSALVQSLVFSMGCHSGFSASDILIGATSTDWAQQLGTDGALFVGNTGFGYGDTKTVAYTEHLMELFAEQVTTPLELPAGNGTASSTVGQALTWAKNAYMSEVQTFSVYDEKALQESTFYGLPFYRVGLQATTPDPTPVRTTTVDSTGSPTISTTIDSDNLPNPSPEGLYFYNLDDQGKEQVIVAPGRPIQPKTSSDISVVSPTDPRSLDQVAVGAMVLGMSSMFTPVPDPVVATPVFDQSSSQPEPDLTDVAFPSKPVVITTTTTPLGERQQLVVATGQYRSDTLTQRLDDAIDVVVYYADPSNTDVTAPTVSAATSTRIGDRLYFTVTATDDAGGTGVDRVYVLALANPGQTGTWVGVDLVDVAGTDRWTGSIALTPGTTDVEFMVQVKDDAGNVGVASNKATGFTAAVAAPTSLPEPPTSALTVTTPGADGATFSAPVVVTVGSTSGAVATVDGTRTETLPAGTSTFTISGDGPHTWSVTSSEGYTKSGTVLIDTTAPAVTSTLASGTTTRPTSVTFRGTDNGSGVTGLSYRVADPDITPIGFTPVPGAEVTIPLTVDGGYTITVNATDAAGNTSTATFTYTVDSIAPVVTAKFAAGAPTPNSAGWLNSPTIVEWEVNEPGATVPASLTLLDQSPIRTFVSEPSCDAAGNCATGSVTVGVDLTVPSGTLTISPEPNVHGWNNTDVTLQLESCADNLSGTQCPAATVLATNTTAQGQSVTVPLVDAAGNVTNFDAPVIRIDKDAPTILWTGPANNSVLNTSPDVSCTTVDPLSGPDGACIYTITSVTIPGYVQSTAVATGQDKAGNETTLTVTWKVRTNLDPPTIEYVTDPAPNAAGWFRTDVEFTFTCRDDADPVVEDCPAPLTFSSEGRDQDFTVTATDSSGNVATRNIAYSIDKTAPTIAATAPTSVTSLDTVTLTCTATDLTSGIDHALSDCGNNSFPASQLQPGANVFTFTAADNAGNVATVTRTVTLVVSVNPAPTVRTDMGVSGLNDVGFRSNIVIIHGTYADPSGPGPYTASVRWTAGGKFTPLILADDGSFVAAWIYGSAGTRTVTVRICDAGGACGTDDLTVRSGVTQKITPVRECVTDRGATVSPRYQARWGYNNPATFAIVVPSIPLLENTFTSSPFLRGQPQIFLPGNQRGVFTTTFSSGTHTWKINGNSASATSTSTRC